VGTEDIMEVVISKNNIPIRLTCRQWAHIVENHDYMSGCMDIVPETVADPDVIVQGKSGEMIALRHCHHGVYDFGTGQNNSQGGYMAEMKFLQSVPYLLTAPSRRIWIDYDDEADVLYVSFRKPQRANDSIMEEDNVICHYRDDELVGMTVLQASANFGTG